MVAYDSIKSCVILSKSYVIQIIVRTIYWVDIMSMAIYKIITLKKNNNNKMQLLFIYFNGYFIAVTK